MIEIIEIQGSVLLTRRKWYQLFKIGWCKYHDGYGRMWWIKFSCPKEVESSINKLVKIMDVIKKQELKYDD